MVPGGGRPQAPQAVLQADSSQAEKISRPGHHRHPTQWPLPREARRVFEAVAERAAACYWCVAPPGMTWPTHFLRSWWIHCAYACLHALRCAPLQDPLP